MSNFTLFETKCSVYQGKNSITLFSDVQNVTRYQPFNYHVSTSEFYTDGANIFQSSRLCGTSPMYLLRPLLTSVKGGESRGGEGAIA